MMIRFALTQKQQTQYQTLGVSSHLKLGIFEHLRKIGQVYLVPLGISEAKLYQKIKQPEYEDAN